MDVDQSTDANCADVVHSLNIALSRTIEANLETLKDLGINTEVVDCSKLKFIKQKKDAAHYSTNALISLCRGVQIDNQIRE